MKQLAIVGKGKNYEKVDAVSIEKWAVSTVFRKLKNGADRIFNLHRPELFEYWLENKKEMVYTFYGIYNKIDYKKITDIFGYCFYSSISWMLAQSYIEGYEKVYIYGVDMKAKGEYGYQRDNLFFLLGFLKARGIEVIIDRESGIFTEKKLYGVQ